MYADDTTFLASNREMKNLVNNMNVVNENAASWFNANGLLINEKKDTTLMVQPIKD